VALTTLLPIERKIRIGRQVSRREFDHLDHSILAPVYDRILTCSVSPCPSIQWVKRTTGMDVFPDENIPA
jgi:hypothetical protein